PRGAKRVVRPERQERTMRTWTRIHFGTRLLTCATTISVVACASAGGTSTGGGASQAGSATPTPVSGTPATAGQSRAPTWRLATLEHVDLWLHGFALLTSDTGHVPFFARGYKQRIVAAKRQRNLFTQLDANQQDLSARFA